MEAAGEGNGLTITLMMERNSPFANIQYTSTQLAGADGVSFAVSNDQMGAIAALKTQGQSLPAGAIFSLRSYYNDVKCGLYKSNT